jgi:glycosyltransferase involved in cell wall biosynthesis
VLITDKVNIWREVLADGAGIVAPDTQPGVEELLAAWLKMSEAERAGMSARARECFQRRFDITGTARSFLDILEELGLSA